MFSTIIQHRSLVKFVILLAGSSLIQAQSVGPNNADKIPVSAVQGASEVGLSLSSGFDYSTGKFGLQDKTDTAVGYLTGKCSYKDWTVRVYVPYESISTSGAVTIVNGRPVATGGLAGSGLTRAQILKQSGLTLVQFQALTAKQKQVVIDAAVKAAAASGSSATPSESRTRNSGFGDASISGDFDIYSNKKTGTFISVTGGIKLATGDDEKGLGSGKTDYSLSADLYQIMGNFTPYMSIGYNLVGKPADSELRDYYSVSIGSTYSITTSTDIDFMFSTSGPSSQHSGVDSEISLGVSQDLGDSWNVDLHALVGVSSYAPDFGAGIRFRVSF